MSSDLEWEPVDEEPSTDYRVFSVSRRRARHPRDGSIGTFSIIHAPLWANIVALTPDDRVVLVRQFRHGTASVTLEIPGGMVEPGEEGIVGAKRELREETGYEAARWLELGVVRPNPAIQDNACELWLAVDAVASAQTAWDPGEVIEIDRVPLSEIPDLILSGEIDHSLVVAAFFYLRERAGGWSGEAIRALV